jgi:FdhD protein
MITTGSSEKVLIERWRSGSATTGEDRVAVETPVSLVYNGVSHTVMLATPADLEDFALGFSLSEGILTDPRELYDIEIETREDGILLHLTVAAERFDGLQRHRRSQAGRTGCGLCGAESLDQVVRKLAPVASDLRVMPDALQRAAAALTERQELQRQTGATHAAAWIDSQGTVLLLREDVGRHNALDKLLGALSKAHTDFSQGALLVTSRASYEMVQKAVSAGVGLLAAVSAPTALAIERALDWNLTLVGFLRPGSHVVYAHGWRLTDSPSLERPQCTTTN